MLGKLCHCSKITVRTLIIKSVDENWIQQRVRSTSPLQVILTLLYSERANITLFNVSYKNAFLCLKIKSKSEVTGSPSSRSVLNMYYCGS